MEEEVVPQTTDAIVPERAVGLCLAGQVQTSTVAGKNRWKGDRRRGGCSANHDRGYSCRRDRGWMAEDYFQSEIVRTFGDDRKNRTGCSANHERGYSCRCDWGWMPEDNCQSENVHTFGDGRRSRMGCTLTKVH